jgi:hypothetical protein
MAIRLFDRRNMGQGNDRVMARAAATVCGASPPREGRIHTSLAYKPCLITPIRPRSATPERLGRYTLSDVVRTHAEQPIAR